MKEKIISKLIQLIVVALISWHFSSVYHMEQVKVLKQFCKLKGE